MLSSRQKSVCSCSEFKEQYRRAWVRRLLGEQREEFSERVRALFHSLLSQKSANLYSSILLLRSVNGYNWLQHWVNSRGSKVQHVVKGVNFVLTLVKSEDRGGSQVKKRQILLWWFSIGSMNDNPYLKKVT